MTEAPKIVGRYVGRCRKHVGSYVGSLSKGVERASEGVGSNPPYPLRFSAPPRRGASPTRWRYDRLCLVRPYSEVFRKLLVAPLSKDPRPMAGPDLRDTRIGGKAPGRDLCLKFREPRVYRSTSSRELPHQRASSLRGRDPMARSPVLGRPRSFGHWRSQRSQTPRSLSSRARLCRPRARLRRA